MIKGFAEKVYGRLERNKIPGWIPYIGNYPSDNPTVEIFRNLGNAPESVQELYPEMKESEIIGELSANFEPVNIEGTPCVRMIWVTKLTLKNDSFELPFYMSEPVVFKDYLTLKGGHFKVSEVLSREVKTLEHKFEELK